MPEKHRGTCFVAHLMFFVLQDEELSLLKMEEEFPLLHCFSRIPKRRFLYMNLSMSQCLPFPHFVVADGPKLSDNLKDQNADAVDLDYLVDNFKSPPEQNADAVDLDTLVNNFKSVQTTTVLPPSQNADAVDSEELADTFNSVQTTTTAIPPPPHTHTHTFNLYRFFRTIFNRLPNITVLDSLKFHSFRSVDCFVPLQQDDNSDLALQLAPKSYLQELLINTEEPVNRKRRRSSMFAVASGGIASRLSKSSPSSNLRPTPDSPSSVTVASRGSRVEKLSPPPATEDHSAEVEPLPMSTISDHIKKKITAVGGLRNTASILQSTVRANVRSVRERESMGQNKVAPGSSPDKKRHDVRRESVILPFLNRKTIDAHGCTLDTPQALLQERKETMLFWMGKHMFYKILNALRLINCFFLAMFFVQIIPLSIKEKSYVVLIAASIPSFLVLGLLQPAILELYSFVCAIGHMKAEVYTYLGSLRSCRK